jgi:predicted phosphodiesterase
VHEGLILRLAGTGNRLFLAHGHQADPINDRWWRLSRFFVRHFWRHLQLLGINDPTSPAKNYRKRGAVDARLTAWAKSKGQILIAGHTHRPRLPIKGESSYLNTGSCVHPRCITGIEIAAGEIRLIKWWISPDDSAHLCVTREVLESMELSALFQIRSKSLSHDST